MKIMMMTSLVVLLSVSYVKAEPGGTYTLTGNEKGVSEIIKADMKQFPELYKGESLSGYTSKFKRENKIGQRKLSPGDQLHFPETFASIKAQKAQKAQGGHKKLLLTDEDRRQDAYQREQAAYQEGVEDAKRDLKNNIYRIESSGKSTRKLNAAYQRALNKYNIKLKVVGACLVSPEIRAHKKGYNEIMKAEIRRKFGRDVFKKAGEKAHEEWSRQKP